MDELKAELVALVKDMTLDEVIECIAEHGGVDDATALGAFLKK